MDTLGERYFYGIKENQPVQEYRNVYFDTKDYMFFNLHRKGKYNRLKIRIRQYQNEVPMTFIECKQKVKGRHTRKERKPIPKIDSQAMREWFLQKHLRKYELTPEDLERQTEISYQRISLIAKDLMSRATIDFQIKAQNQNQCQIELIPDHCIFEIKQRGYPKEMIKILQSNFRLRQTPFSKYCVALCMLDSSVKDNKWRRFIKRYCTNERT